MKNRYTDSTVDKLKDGKKCGKDGLDGRPDRGCLDNGASLREIRFLAQAYNELGDGDFRDAAEDSVKWLLDTQHGSGGWPQYGQGKCSGYSCAGTCTCAAT